MNLTLQTIPSPLISELLTHSSLDGVVLDTEHGHFNNETLYSCIQIITLRGKKCFVRFTDLNKQLVRMCLDAGIDGVIFSTIENYTEANEIISYCKYPSQGGKRGCGLVRENKWGEKQLDEHKPIIIGQIETKTAIDNLQELIQCEFDIFLIGPYDISSSLKNPGKFGDPIYLNYINKIYDVISLDKLGLFLPTNKDINNYKSLNKKRPNLLIWGMDTDFILESLKNISTQLW
jgi:2-keto-3-deoxy-L-rhamnonate aldolase RhmA